MGLPPTEIFFDTLALPISTGIEEDRENGKATINPFGAFVKSCRDVM